MKILTENKEEKKAGERQIQTSEPYRNRKRRKERHSWESDASLVQRTLTVRGSIDVPLVSSLTRLD